MFNVRINDYTYLARLVYHRVILWPPLGTSRDEIRLFGHQPWHHEVNQTSRHRSLHVSCTMGWLCEAARVESEKSSMLALDQT